MKWGYERGTDANAPVPVSLDITSHCHALVTGASGSGKSYALLYLLGSLIQDDEMVDVYFCDFKNSEDFAFLEGLQHYYAGDDCYDGVMKFYEEFCNARKNRSNKRRKLLIFDEYPAFINYLSGIDKRDKTKKANDILGVIAEVLMLGRGIGYGIWIVTQRADASLFANGARDNFMIVLGLGRLSKEQKTMIFAGEEIPDRVFNRGEGMMLADGYSIKEITIPRIRNSYEWKKGIKMIMVKNRCID